MAIEDTAISRNARAIDRSVMPAVAVYDQEGEIRWRQMDKLVVVGAALLALYGLTKLQGWYFGWLGAVVVTYFLMKKGKNPLPGMFALMALHAYISYPITAYAFFDGKFFHLGYEKVLQPLAQMVPVQWLALAGTMGFYFGAWGLVQILYARMPRMRRVDYELPSMELLVKLWAVGAFIGWLGHFVPLSLRQVTHIFAHLELLAVGTILWIAWTRNDGRALFIGFAGLGFYFIRSATSGLFGGPMVYFALVCVLYLRAKGRPPYLLLLFFVFFILIIEPMKSSYRDPTFHMGELKPVRLVAAVIETGSRLLGPEATDVIATGLNDFGRRIDVSNVLRAVREHMLTHRDYEHGRTIWDALVTSFVPRFLWPGKPRTGGRSTLAVRYAEMQSVPGTSFGVGAISEFYINWGTAGVLLGMPLLGMFTAACVCWVLKSTNNALSLMAGLLVFSIAIRPETNVSDIVGAMLRFLFLWIVLYFALLRKQPQPVQGF